MVEAYFKAVADQEELVVRESPVLCEVAGVLSDNRNPARLRAEYRKRLAVKYW